MKITTPVVVAGKPPTGLGFSIHRIENLLRSHDDEQRIEWADLVVHVLVRRRSGQADLAVAHRKSGHMFVPFACTLFADLAPGYEIKDQQPVDLLGLLIERFGVDLQFGGRVQKLFLEEHIEGIVEPTTVTAGGIPSALTVIGQRQSAGLDLALAFAIDVRAYNFWASGQKQTR
jgi:hypothetical protein